MWKWLYNIVAHLAIPFLAIVGLLNGKVRKNLRERLFPEPVEHGLRDLVWIHGASLGEAVIAQNLLERISLQMPRARFLVTTNTYYARDLLRGKLGPNAIIRSLPFDLPFSISRLMGNSTFRGLILVETELWPNLIWTAHRRDIPVIVVNGRVSDATIRRYNSVSPFLKDVLSCVSLVLAQSSIHAGRFVQLGVPPSRVIESGNLKYFRTVATAPRTRLGDGTVTFGSIKEKEVDTIVDVAVALKKRFPRLLMYMVPRELHLVNTIESALRHHLATARYSAIGGGAAPSEGLDIIVVDTVGDLLDIYSRSHVAFVGGSLAPYGGQNMLEPLFFETPVLFGPHVENFREISQEILRVGGGIAVADGDELLEQITLLLSDEEARTRMGKAGGSIIDTQNQVMADTVNRVMEVLWKDYSQSS